ncbi:exonuclease SbcCD subunit D [uncultured Bacteroides sp.]|jgi:exonuclease SbcD|uniref:exonuclease SbcCD subunit D n=1 Tax=uncultured Bacteroides sp. TaxID=162156 RepID=UPI00280B6D94|nr:exonuclease SbcCD subunit D [uncultured Bacteroides sp.]
MIRILATGDWHLGNNFHGFDRQEEHEHFLRWLLDTIAEKHPDVLLVSGDVFDSANPSAASQELYYTFLDDLSRRFSELQTVIIAGNHDSAARLEAPRQILERHKVYVRGLCPKTENGEISVDYLLVPLHACDGSGERAWVLAVPYLRIGDFRRGAGYGEGMSECLEELVSRAGSRRESGKEAMILLAHLYATGSMIADNSSERIVVGGSEMVDLHGLESQVTLGVLGHLHKNQYLGDRRVFVYPGSALPMSFTERSYRHGVVYYEIEDGELNGVSEFISYPLQHPLLSLPDKPAPLENVLDILSGLPDGQNDASAPYLEVNVLLDTPVAGINKQIEDVLLHKHVRLCRTVISYRVPVTGSDDVELESVEDLLNLNPVEVIRKSYLNKYKCEMRPELEALAMQAVEAARKEGEE